MQPYYVLHYTPGADGTVINLLQGVMALGKKRKLDAETTFRIDVVSQSTPEPNVLDWNCDSPPLLSVQAQEALSALDLMEIDFISTCSGNPILHNTGLKALHCRNRVACIDIDNSDVDDDVVIFGVNKLCLDHDALAAIDESRRQLFSHPGASHILFASAHVANTLKAANLNGLVITPVEEYTC